MSQNGILKNNEREANRFAARVMLFTTVFLALVYVLDLLRIFIVSIPTMTIAVGIGAVLLILPFFLVEVLKLHNSAIKYITVTAAVLMVAVLNVFLSYHVVLLFIYPIAIASLFFSRSLSWYTVVLSVIFSSCSQILNFLIAEVDDKNFKTLTEAVMYGVGPRTIELIAISVIFIMLARRTRSMLQNIMGAEEQKSMLERMQTATDKSGEISRILSDSVSQLSVITAQTTASNEQIAENTAKIAAGSEETLRFTEETTTLVDGMSEKLNSIASQSRNMAEISNQLMQTNENSGKIIRNAVEEMQAIVGAAEDSRRNIGILEQKSSEIGRIVEVITGISGQTNLLALNAAIESARAGEQGKGFAVVADEIRKLAEQSQKATKDISKLIAEVLEDTGKTVEAIDRSTEMAEKGLESINAAGKSFEQVYSAGSEMNNKVQQVSGLTVGAAENGNHVSELVHKIMGVNRNNLQEINTIAAASQEQVASMEEVAAAVETISRLSEDLNETR